MSQFSLDSSKTAGNMEFPAGYSLNILKKTRFQNVPVVEDRGFKYFISRRAVPESHALLVS
jgi:hypothetical protein